MPPLPARPVSRRTWADGLYADGLMWGQPPSAVRRAKLDSSRQTAPLPARTRFCARIGKGNCADVGQRVDQVERSRSKARRPKTLVDVDYVQPDYRKVLAANIENIWIPVAAFPAMRRWRSSSLSRMYSSEPQARSPKMRTGQTVNRSLSKFGAVCASFSDRSFARLCS
jgi:hypothetical protein